jgi:hypothetical protein
VLGPDGSSGTPPAATTPGGPPEPPAAWWRRWDPASWAFAAYLVFGFFFALHAGSHYWFHADEWRILGRTDWSLGDLFTPQNGHWSTVPFLFYRVWYRIFGLHSYLAYQVPLLVLHLTLATFIRITMRRSGVSPWVATVVAGSFVLLGSGEQNILSPIQVSMVGSVTFGYAQLLLLDHDGGWRRRDALGVAMGLLALMSSGIGAVMAGVVGLAALLRRGWLAAAVHGGSLLVVYGIWTASQSSEAIDGQFGGPEYALPWLSHGVSGVLVALGHAPVLATALGLLTVVGLGLAWIGMPWATWRRRAALPVGLLAGLAAMYVLLALNRGVMGESFARSSRYLAIGAALLLPTVGVAIDAIARRWRYGFLALVPLAVAIPLEASTLGEKGFPKAFYPSVRTMVLATAYSPCLGDAPDDLEIDVGPFVGGGVTVRFLREAHEGGHLPPAPDDVPRATHEAVATLLGCEVDRQVEGYPEAWPEP